MATTAFTAFLPEVLPLVPACSDLVAVNAVRNACYDFCAGALIWNEFQDAEAINGDSFPFDLTAPTGARVCSVMSLSIDGRPVAPVFLDALESLHGWQEHSAEAPQGYCQSNPDQLFLYPKLSRPATMVLRCAYAPTRSATGVESFIFHEYLEKLAAGALGKLMKMPGQPWSNPELSAYYSTVFEQSISEAAARVNKSFSRAATMVAMRPLV